MPISYVGNIPTHSANDRPNRLHEAARSNIRETFHDEHLIRFQRFHDPVFHHIHDVVVDSSSTVADLQSQIAAKQAELSSARTDEEKQEIEDEITELKAELAKAQAAEKQASEKTSGATSQSSKPASYANEKLAGESERIGTVNFSEETPFGERTAWV